jgi:tetratricopeptide (TPR) repeat protein
MHHADGTISELTEKIRLTPRRMSKRGIEGRWHLKLRTLYRERGALYESKGDYDKAIVDYSEVIKTFLEGRTDHWSELICDYFSRARAYRLRGDYDGAIADYSAMIELYPRLFLAPSKVWVAAYYKIRGETYCDKGDYGKAIEDLTEAIRLDPRDVLSISRRGEIIHTEGTAFDPGEAEWKRRHALAILAAVYARSGNFDQARQYQRKLLELPDLTEEDAAEGRKCLALYDVRANRDAI